MIPSPLILLISTLLIPTTTIFAWDNSPPECPYPCLPPPTTPSTNCPPPPLSPSEPVPDNPPPAPATPGSGYYYSPPPPPAPGYFPYFPPPSFNFPAPPPPNPILPYFPWYYKTPPRPSGAVRGLAPVVEGVVLVVVGWLLV